MKTAADMIDPVGDVTLAMFPEDDMTSMTAKLQEYLNRGYELAAVVLSSQPQSVMDIGALAWAYHITFSAVAARLAATNASQTLQGLGSLGISSSQIAYYADRAKFWLSEWTQLQEASEGVVPSRPTEQTVHTVSWW